jgi:hypothetical protein
MKTTISREYYQTMAKAITLGLSTLLLGASLALYFYDKF